MAKRKIKCPSCRREIEIWDSPKPVVDILIEFGGGVLLIKRKNPPYGWAIPGGFVDYGERVEEAAVREAREETSLKIKNLRQFRVYSDPRRDKRVHTISTVFTASGEGKPKAADDAADVGVFTRENLPDDLAFDHRDILNDYFASKRTLYNGHTKPVDKGQDH